MHMTQDNEKYEELHDRLLRDILLAIKEELEAADLDHDTVHELTANIAMAVTTLIDGGSPVQVAGESMMPFLAFASEQRENIIVADHGSHLHELVDSLFESMEAEEDDDYDEDEEDEDEEDEEEDDYEYEEDEEASDEEEELEEEDEEESAEEENSDKRRH